MAKPLKLYWDTCMWIGLINEETDKARELEIVYNYAKQGKYELWTSTFSMVECRSLSGEIKADRPWSDQNEKLIMDMFSQPFVKPISMGADIAEEARKIYRTTPGLGKFQDSIHLASALRWNIPVFHTYDTSDLIHLSGKFRFADGTAITICFPDETTDGPLFSRARSG